MPKKRGLRLTSAKGISATGRKTKRRTAHPKPICSAPASSIKKRNLEENLISAVSFPSEATAHLREFTIEGTMIAGNRVTNLSYIFSQLKTISAHGNRLGCTFQNFLIEKEVRWGLYSLLFLKCEKCNESFKVENICSKSFNESDINVAAMNGIRSISRGFDDLERFLGSLNIPYRSQKPYQNYYKLDAVVREEVSVEVMKAKMSKNSLNDEVNYSSQKKSKLEEDANTSTNSSNEPKIKKESSDNLNYETAVKQEEVYIKDEIIEEEETEPSFSFTSKIETTINDTTVEKQFPETSFDHIFQFKITLQRNYWRQIQVPGYYNFRDLHLAIQKSMGWQSVLMDQHLHKFELINPDTHLEESILMPDDVRLYDGLTVGEVKNELNTKIAHYFKTPGHKARYEYEYFGISWDHEVLLEKILAPKEGETYPKCIAWKGVYPSEDEAPCSDQEKVDFDPFHCFDS